MYLDTFLGAVGVDQDVIAKIRSNLNAFADDISSVDLAKAGGFGGSAAGHRMTKADATLLANRARALSMAGRITAWLRTA